MELIIHFNAKQDLDRLFEKDGETAGYPDVVTKMIQANSATFGGSYENKCLKGYGEPMGPFDLEARPILPLWKKSIKVSCVRFDSEEVAGYRITYAPCHEKQPSSAYIHRVDMLATANKNTDKFSY